MMLWRQRTAPARTPLRISFRRQRCHGVQSIWTGLEHEYYSDTEALPQKQLHTEQQFSFNIPKTTFFYLFGHQQQVLICQRARFTVENRARMIKGCTLNFASSACASFSASCFKRSSLPVEGGSDREGWRESGGRVGITIVNTTNGSMFG